MNNLIKNAYESFAKEPIGEEKGKKRDDLENAIKQEIMDTANRKGGIMIKKGAFELDLKHLDVLFWHNGVENVSDLDSASPLGLEFFLSTTPIRQVEVITLSFIFAAERKDISKRIKDFHSINFFLLTYDTEKHDIFLHNEDDEEVQVIQMHIQMKDLISSNYDIVSFLNII